MDSFDFLLNEIIQMMAVCQNHLVYIDKLDFGCKCLGNFLNFKISFQESTY